jgi:hypothetical protein
MGLDQYAYATKAPLLKDGVESDVDFEMPTEATGLSPVLLPGMTPCVRTPWDERTPPGEADAIRFFQWRKHPDLHGWMSTLWRLKGGSAQDESMDEGSLNASNAVRLTEDDLDSLELDVRANALPHTTGFFFGESQPEDRDDDLAFIAEARRYIKEGYKVYYSAWW